MITVSDAWVRAMPTSRRVASRAELWNGNTFVDVVPMLTGTVTDQWATGTRRVLAMTVPPTVELKALQIANTEVRLFQGVDYGFGPPELVQMGCFPVTGKDAPIRHTRNPKPDAPIKLTCDDRWQWVINSPFLSPRSADIGLTIAQQIQRLVVETAQWTIGQVLITATSTAPVVAQTWDTDRHAAIAALAITIGAEVFCDRLGRVIIQDRQAATAPVTRMRTGDGGVLLDMIESESTADVYNVVRIASTTTDPAFAVPAVVVRITDPTHPAYPRPGVPVRPYQLTSAQYTTTAQAKAAAQKVLTKISGKARQVVLTSLPDPSLDAGDTVAFTWPDGTSEVGQLAEIVHGLRAADETTMTTHSTRSDEDFLP